MLTKLRMTTEIVEARSGALELLLCLDRLVDGRFFGILTQKLVWEAAFCVPDPDAFTVELPRSAATIAWVGTGKLK